MKNKILTVILIFSCSLVVSGCVKKEVTPEEKAENKPIINVTNNMKITSSQFKNNEEMPDKYGCQGTNINPPLQFSEVPAEAKSLAVIVDDPDAPRGTWTHWVMFNIPPETREIPEGGALIGVTQGVNDFGNANYGEPCPPFGTHRYFFKVYALDTTFNLGDKATKQDLEKAMAGHILDQTEIIGLFTRK